MSQNFYIPRSTGMPPQTSVDDLMLALNDHRTGAGEPLLDATFLGTLQIRSHRLLLEAVVDQPNKSVAMLQALSALGQSWTAQLRRPTALDATRLVSRLRDAVLEFRGRPSVNLLTAINKWQREEAPDGED